MGARVEGDEVGCTARGGVGRRLEARAGSAGPRPQVRVHGSAAHHARGASAFRPGELSRGPLVPATLVSHQPVATDVMRAPIILRALHPGFDHACQRS